MDLTDGVAAQIKVRELQGEIERLGSENEQLRRLVADYHRALAVEITNNGRAATEQTKEEIMVPTPREYAERAELKIAQLEGDIERLKAALKDIRDEVPKADIHFQGKIAIGIATSALVLTQQITEKPTPRSYPGFDCNKSDD